MGRWCAGLPVVRVERSQIPRPLPVIVPYYENPDFFLTQLLHWAELQAEWRSRLAFIVVDDGSPVHPAADVADAFRQQVPIRVFRIEQDVRWNWLAARNIAAHHADEGWLLLTDMDHRIPVETFEAVLYGVHRIDTIYGFSRVEHTGQEIEPHKNSWLMTKRMFWTVGGYDEAFSGYYGSDGDWRRRCAKTAPMAILSDRLVRYEFVQDASTARYQRKEPQDAAIQKIVKARGPKWTPKTLSFPYREVASC